MHTELISEQDLNSNPTKTEALNINAAQLTSCSLEKFNWLSIKWTSKGSQKLE